MKKWYVFKRFAEGNALFFVALTDNEFQIICNFLDRQCNGPDTGYSGSISTASGNKNFSSREEAERWAKEHYQLIYAYDESTEGLAF